MVQYIHTPWRDRAELLKVRQQFYPSSPSLPPTSAEATIAAAAATTTAFSSFSATAADPQSSEEAQKRHAVWRVSMWMQRGSCPHMVESTSLLTAAILLDLQEARNGADSLYEAVRLAYSAAFSRFVTGLLDGQQEKQQKQSMWSIAKIIGLPATFVELRHQCTHEQLPPLLKLRSAAQKSLVWIWDYYWRHLPSDESQGNPGASARDACVELMLSYLQETDAARQDGLKKRMRQYDEVLVLEALSEIESSCKDPMMLRRSLQLYSHIVGGGLGSASENESSRSGKDLAAIQADLAQQTSQLEALPQISKANVEAAAPIECPVMTKGWSRFEGPWKPKPIGVI
ncbi:Las1-like-domain-containing protein [Apiospora saccharicola]|uniref:Las1-like-domain-containing protein n=1 Tax=Apiospora saccharicola TaxID=335842 RepID=A0ABR1TM92_9PEZI